ncbi:hypothetical protein BJV77DRAFT_1038937 [Russula vinacea]|nr:hypothetical protein BJV77DRAFT_1038937 [Russula vinacea]
MRTYKKCSTDEQHSALTTVPTIMRLSILALFIALPAATYAAVTTRQLACSQSQCLGSTPCCAGLSCLNGVRIIAHSL